MNVQPADEIAKQYWGDDVPDWVMRLAEQCMASSQNQVAKNLGYSASVVNQVLRHKYAGNLTNIEDVVRGKFMAEVVDCPYLGRLPKHECKGWRDKARKFVGSSPFRVRMFKACGKCPINQQGASDE